MERSLKILIAEDDVISCRALEKNIQDWGYSTVVTKNGRDAWEIIKKGDIRLAILDWNMPKMNGIELCNKIRTDHQQEKSKYIYVILLTARDLQEDIITGLSAGADDYMTKPCSYLELKVRIQNGERIISLEDNRLEMANTDGLTQIWNHSKIVDLLEEELERNHRDGKSLAVIMIDIDHFKKVNDNYGHVMGDKVLVELAAHLRKSLRLYDKVGRYGGDEFMIILPGCDEKNAAKIGDRIRKSVNELSFEGDLSSPTISISIGIAVSDEGCREAAEDLMKRSDKALYLTKKRGRNRTTVLGPCREAYEERK